MSVGLSLDDFIIFAEGDPNAIIKLSLLSWRHFYHASIIVFVLRLVPSHPRNVTVHEVTSSTIKISWLEPEKPNGPNLIYRIYYTSLNQTHLAMPKNDPENGMRSEAGTHYYTLKKLRECRVARDRADVGALGIEQSAYLSRSVLTLIGPHCVTASTAVAETAITNRFFASQVPSRNTKSLS